MKIHSKFVSCLVGETKNSHRTISLEKEKKKKKKNEASIIHFELSIYLFLFISLTRFIIKEN